AGPSDPRRTYLVVVDTLHTSSASFNRVREVLTKFFEKERSADTQYSVIALGRNVKVVQDSTRDASAALSAVRTASFSGMILDSEAANLATAADQFAALMRGYCSVCRCVSAGNLNTADLPTCPDAKSRVQAFLTSFSQRTFFLNE